MKKFILIYSQLAFNTHSVGADFFSTKEELHNKIAELEEKKRINNPDIWTVTFDYSIDFAGEIAREITIEEKPILK